MGLTIAGFLTLVLAAPTSRHFFEIEVVDDQTGRGVPLIELRTVNSIRLVTDSAGRVAFYEPGLMNRTVYFAVSGHGYEFKKDAFGFRGVRLETKPGGKATIKVRRLNVAERLYRVTGAGIYADTQQLGLESPIKQPLLNADVFGSDSVVNAVYRDKIYWFWGDTNRPSYPLGNFHVPGAVSDLPAKGGLSPAVGVNLEYFSGKDGFAKPTAQMPGKGPTWINGLTVLRDDNGRESLFTMYVKIKPPMTVYERGIAEFDDDEKRFRKLRTWDLELPLFPSGHPFHHHDGGVDYVYFATPYALVRVPAKRSAFLDPRRYETYSYLSSGPDEKNMTVERGEGGRLKMRWRQNTLRLNHKRERQLIDQDRIREDEAWLRLRDVDSDKQVRMHGGSISWNQHREKWIMIGIESFGTSLLGEVWYTEADDPVGPWRVAKKIVSHNKYSFYNPKQHPFFDTEGGRYVFFEGTYTNMFSGNPDRTPRYNYNQVMYRLDLSHPDLRSLQQTTTDEVDP